jgi:hypothetical protein
LDDISLNLNKNQISDREASGRQQQVVELQQSMIEQSEEVRSLRETLATLEQKHLAIAQENEALKIQIGTVEQNAALAQQYTKDTSGEQQRQHELELEYQREELVERH